jgi:hypothetical protein
METKISIYLAIAFKVCLTLLFVGIFSHATEVIYTDVVSGDVNKTFSNFSWTVFKIAAGLFIFFRLMIWVWVTPEPEEAEEVDEDGNPTTTVKPKKG